MGTRRATTTIERSADHVWATIGRFGSLDWYLNVERCTLDGRLRTAFMGGMDMEVDELEVAHDDAARTYTYAVVAFRGTTKIDLPDGTVLDVGPMTNHHTATVTVTPLSESTSQVTYDVEIDDGYDDMLDSTRGGYQAVIDALKRNLEQ